MSTWNEHEHQLGNAREGWIDNSYPHEDSSRLYASIELKGVLFHIDAIEVVIENNLMVTPDGKHDEALEKFYDAFSGDGYFSTAEINGRRYALFLSPFCE